MTNIIRKDITISRHKFVLEIYIALEGHNDISWEIFPEDYKACLYAFSNKKSIENIVTKKYLYEPNKKGEDAPSRV